MARFFSLAELLGADVSAPAVRAARSRYDAARNAVREAADGNPGLAVVALYADTGAGTAYFQAPDEFYPQLRQLAELGLDLAEIPAGGEEVSLEELDQYPADLLLVDSFNDLDALADVPTWTSLPAVAARQTVGYEPLVQYRYDQQAAELEAVAAAVRAADPNLV